MTTQRNEAFLYVFLGKFYRHRSLVRFELALIKWIFFPLQVDIQCLTPFVEKPVLFFIGWSVPLLKTTGSRTSCWGLHSTELHVCP
jgi:hypothetical protein